MRRLICTLLLVRFPSFFHSAAAATCKRAQERERERARTDERQESERIEDRRIFVLWRSFNSFFLYILNVYSRTETTTINKYLAATTAVLATRERGEESAASQAKCAPQ